MNRCTCLFSGRVQGVGFRYTVKNIALQYDVRGYVRNTPDGRVELVLEGPDEQITSMVSDVQERMKQYIQAVDQQRQPATGEFGHFYIKH